MHKVLVSSCLIGEPVRYDGLAARSGNPVLVRWLQEERIIPYCPEVVAGLGIPRPPVELTGGDGADLLETRARAMESTGEDATAAFLAGAQAAVALCERLGIRVAVLKEGSPSCGSTRIHDGTFSGTTVPGQGVTVAALRGRGVNIYSEDQWDQAQACLSELEAP